ncbi:MAG: hypothetical protein UHU19_18660 [Lachnospiraceae bacterium]|nr:hypothetical protein [Lachnospiraceae bacterium]
MKLQKQNQKAVQHMILGLLVFIIFLTGVHLDKNQTNPFLQYRNENLGQAHISHEVEMMTDTDLCMDEQMGRLHMFHLTVHEGIIHRGERVHTIYIFFFLWMIFAGKLFFRQRGIHFADETILILHRIIIRYIHRKDGAKSNVPMT